MHDDAPPLQRKRAFRWLLGSSSLSMLGSRLTTIAYPMLILYLHGSPVIAGLAVFAANAPSFLIYIPAGVLVDRWNPRLALLAAETGRGIVIGFIAVLLFLHWATVELIIAAAIFEESLEVFAMLAERRYVRMLVEPRHAPTALASIETRTHVAMTAGRTLGGLFFGIAQVLPFLADLMSFVASVGSLLFVKPGSLGTPMRARDSQLAGEVRDSKLAREVRDGLRALLRDPVARDASVLSACMTLLSQALIIVFLTEAHSQGVSSVVIGAVLATSGVGGVLGALVAKRTWRPANQSPLQVQPVVWLAMLGLLGASGRWEVPAMAIAMAVLGFSGALSNVELESYLFLHVPPDKQARVASIGMLIDFAACALGPAFGGAITELLGAGKAVWLLFTLTIPCAVFGLRFLHISPPILIPSDVADIPVHHQASSSGRPRSIGRTKVAAYDPAPSTTIVN
jgi:MFS family permease